MSVQAYKSLAKLAITLSRNKSSSNRLMSSAAMTMSPFEAHPAHRRPNLQLQQVAFISKNADKKTTIAAEIIPSAKSKDVSAASSTTAAKKNWVSYGFSYESEEEDLNTRNGIMFFSITLTFVGISFFLAYFPDYRLKSWAQREAFIELARREALGLPLIDRDLVPPEKINLPSEEELGDFEIII